MRIDTQTFPVRRAVSAASRYIGSENEYRDAGTVTGQLAPAADSFSVEMFGAKASSMYTLIVGRSEDIRKNDRVLLHDGEYTVVSVLMFGTHKTASLEKAGAFNGDS